MERGLRMEDWPAIERAEFLHYVTLAWRLGTPTDWTVFRGELALALNAAFSLDGRWVDRDQQLESARVAEQQRRAAALLDEACGRFDPLRQWVEFREALWEGRAPLMIEPAPR